MRRRKLGSTPDQIEFLTSASDVRRASTCKEGCREWVDRRSGPADRLILEDSVGLISLNETRNDTTSLWMTNTVEYEHEHEHRLEIDQTRAWVGTSPGGRMLVEASLPVAGCLLYS